MLDGDIFVLINEDYFTKAEAFAQKLGGKSKDSFYHCLKSLSNIAKNYESKVYLGPDFVEHSFQFAIRDESDQVRLSGGMILHGFSETFSIRLVDDDYPSWSIHT